DLRGRESLHRLTRVDGLVTVPGIVEEPSGFALREGAKRRHANLIEKPVEVRAGTSHVVAAAKFVFVSDGVNDVVELINVGADANCFFLDAGINLGNHHDG